jgi:hypothetical protein
MNACGDHIESKLGHGNMTISLRALFDILKTIFDHEGPCLVLSVYLVNHFIRTNMTKRVNLGHERTAIFFCSCSSLTPLQVLLRNDSFLSTI